VQLVDAGSGAHLWAETYERPFRPEDVFALQDDLAPRIVSTVADVNGVLVRTMSEAFRGRPPDDLSPYEAVLRSFGYFMRVTAEELTAARSALESAVRKDPACADAWAMLAILGAQDHGQGFGLRADCLPIASAAALKAVEAGPANHLAYFSLAQAHFFQRQFEGLRNAAERAVALNPMDGNSIAFMGELLTYAGDRDRGLALAERAKQLNPHHPGWYWYADFFDAYRQGDYRRALGVALKVNLPGHWGSHAAMAAACGQLGDLEAASKARDELLTLRPDFTVTVRPHLAKWFDADLVEHLIEGLRKAGLDVPGYPPGAPAYVPPRPGAGASAASAPAAAPQAAPVAIAVLPFADLSAARDQEYLCEGMADEITHALVRIKGIRVASRTSAARARQDDPGVKAIARALSVGLVLEGSVRTAGSRLRVTAQLTDADSGYQVWSERFDRDAADIFAVQDEIAAGVVDAVKARLDPGAGTIQARPPARNLEAYRSYLKGRFLRLKEDHAGALAAFEDAIRLDPSHAPSWTALAEIQVLSAVFSLVPAREACATARAALARARALEGESADGLHAEGFVAWIERRWPAMDTAWRRAIEMEPTHVQALASFAFGLCCLQRLDDALPLFARAREADPLASFPYMLTGGGLLNCGRHEDARRYLEDALAFEPDDASALYMLGMAQVAGGAASAGIEALQRAVAVSRRGAFFLGTLGWALAVAGRTDEARALLAEMQQRPAGTPTVVSEVWLLCALGRTDEAFEVLERAADELQAMLWNSGLPAFDPLRGDPRWSALMTRLGLRP
jgi:TolB-like protein/Tfp pilus assembly protein PilF